MDDNEKRLEQIKKRLAGNEYFINPHSDANTREDMEFLLTRVAFLEKKDNLLSQQVQELTTEIENVRRDFGNLR